MQRHAEHQKRRARYWGIAWGTAILVHLVVFVCLSWFMKPNYLVTVIQMSPKPDSTVILKPTQALRPVIYFSHTSPSPDAVQLCRLVPTGQPSDCFKAHRHHQNPEALIFEEIVEEVVEDVVENGGEVIVEEKVEVKEDENTDSEVK